MDDSLVQWKRPFFKIGYSGNTQISVWNTNFFPRQPIAKTIFVLHSNYTGDTPYLVWVDLDNSLVRWKRPIFNICYSGNTEISVWKTYFFPRQAISKNSLFYTLITLVILHNEFDLIWTTPWSDEKDLFSKLVIREIRKFPYEILFFFLGNL